MKTIRKILHIGNKPEQDYTELQRSFAKVEPNTKRHENFQQWFSEIVFKYHPVNFKIFDYEN